MALGPQEMAKAITLNLKNKTGKDLAEWHLLLKAQNYADKKTALNDLKLNYGLGHVQAQVVTNSFFQTDWLVTEDWKPTDYFTEEELPLYNFLRESVQQLGVQVKEKPCKTYIPYYAKSQFFVILRYKKQLFVGVHWNKQDSLPAGWVTNIKGGGSDRINAFKKATELTSEDWAVVKQAFALSL